MGAGAAAGAGVAAVVTAVMVAWAVVVWAVVVWATLRAGAQAARLRSSRPGVRVRQKVVERMTAV